MVSKRQRYFYRPVYKAVIKPTAYCLLSPLIIAVVLVECCIPSSYRRRRRGRRDRARQELLGRVDAKYAPQPLVPEERLRPLTRCTNEDPYNPQPASPFFKLPAELRLRIYREALGDNVIHLLLKPYRVGHVVCPDAHVPAEKDPARSCFLPGLSSNKIREYDRWLHRTHDQDSCKDLKSCSLPGHALPQTTVCLAFLLTCRRVYCEAMDILYSDNVFDVSHPQTLALFASTILPERLALIQSLHVSWTQSSDYGQHWPRLWAEVTTKERMPALKHVSLSVQRSYRINDLQQEAIVAPIIEHLRGVDSFDISYMPADSLDVSRDSPDIRQWTELGKRIREIACWPPGGSPAD